MSAFRHFPAFMALALALLAAPAPSARAQAPTPAPASDRLPVPDIERVVQYALENVVSGTRVTEIVRGVEVAVRPIRTWKSVSGHYCRRYEITVVAPGEPPDQTTRTRCRDSDAIWKLVPER